MPAARTDPSAAVGSPARLARESAARAPRRTSATAMALAIGLALISFMSVLAASVKDSVASGYRETIKADYVIESSRNEMLGGVPDRRVRAGRRPAAGGGRLPAAVRTLEGRRDHQRPHRRRPGHPAGRHRPAPRPGPAERPRERRIVLAEHIARERHLALGDTLPMTFARTGRQNLRIVGLLRDQDADGLSTGYLISLATFAQELQRERRRQRLRQARRRRRRRRPPARPCAPRWPTTRPRTSAIRAAPWPAACRPSTRSWAW